MTLNYDYDVFSLIPGNMSDDPDSMESKAALFRDEATVEALRGAHPRVRRVFELAGFGLTMHDSGAGPGRIPERDRGAHGVFLDRVSQLLTEEFSEAEIAEGVLGAPSVDGVLADGVAPEGAFVVLDWLKAAIAVQESPLAAVAPVDYTAVIERAGRKPRPGRAPVRMLAVGGPGPVGAAVPSAKAAEVASAPGKKLLARLRGGAVRPGKEAVGQGGAVQPAVIAAKRGSLVTRLDSPAMGVLAGLMVSGFGIALVTSLLA